jgi:hypothetical protein
VTADCLTQRSFDSENPLKSGRISPLRMTSFILFIKNWKWMGAEQIRKICGEQTRSVPASAHLRTHSVISNN